MNNLNQLRLNFKDFLDKINSRIEDLRKILKKTVKYQNLELDYNYKTIEKIESLYLDVIQQREKIDIDLNEFDDIFIAYIGESVKFHAGGRWILSELKSDEAYGTPIIIDWGKKGSDHISISPYIWKLLLIEEKSPGLISNLIKKMAKYV